MGEEQDIPRITSSGEVIDDEVREELEQKAFDEDKLSWGCETQFVTFVEDVELPSGEKIEGGKTFEIPSALAEKLIEQEVVVSYAWKCLKCGQMHKQREKPIICENPNCSKKGPFKALHPHNFEEIGDMLLKNYNFATPVESVTESKPGRIHVYRGGIYHNQGTKGIIRSKVKDLDPGSKQPKQKHVIDHIVTSGEDISEDAFGLSGERVVIKDGILNLNSLEIEPHDPGALAISKIDVRYDQEAECPRFMKYLEEVFPDKRDIKRLQELLGTALINEKPHKKGIILVGPTDAGKSTLIQIIRRVFGEENTEAQSPYSLSSTRWGKARLRGKKINATDEISEKKLKNLSTIKRIMDGKPVEAEFKGEKTFTFEPKCEHVYAANQTPTADRHDDAFWNRWIPIEMPRSVPRDFPDKEEQDPDLAEKIVEEERGGIFAWIVEGYRDFIENDKKFTYSTEWEDARETWLNYGSALQRFIQSRIEREEGNKIKAKEIYNAVVNYAEKNELDAPSSQAAVTREIKKISYASYSDNYRFDGKKCRGFMGIKIVDPEDTENSNFTTVKTENKKQKKIGKKEDREKDKDKNSGYGKKRVQRVQEPGHIYVGGNTGGGEE